MKSATRIVFNHKYSHMCIIICRDPKSPVQNPDTKSRIQKPDIKEGAGQIACRPCSNTLNRVSLPPGPEESGRAWLQDTLRRVTCRWTALPVVQKRSVSRPALRCRRSASGPASSAGRRCDIRRAWPCLNEGALAWRRTRPRAACSPPATPLRQPLVNAEAFEERAELQIGQGRLSPKK